MSLERVILLLTNACSHSCSFCYRRALIRSLGENNMSPEAGVNAVEFFLSRVDNPDDFIVSFWGGEPLDRPETIGAVTKAFPQLKYDLVSNGGNIDVLRDIHSLSFVWSVGDAEEKYGSIVGKIQANKDIVEFVREKNHAISFFASNYKNIAWDYRILREITDKVILELPMKYKVMSEADIEIASDQIAIIISEYGDDVLLSGRSAKKYLERLSGAKSFSYCGCGLDRMLADGRGDIWLCDGSYINSIDKLGTIHDGINDSLLDPFRALHGNPESIYSECSECEVYGYCLRTKCMGDNIERTGNPFMPDKAFCSGNKAFYRGALKYLRRNNE